MGDSFSTETLRHRGGTLLPKARITARSFHCRCPVPTYFLRRIFYFIQRPVNAPGLRTGLAGRVFELHNSEPVSSKTSNRACSIPWRESGRTELGTFWACSRYVMSCMLITGEVARRHRACNRITPSGACLPGEVCPGRRGPLLRPQLSTDGCRAATAPVLCSLRRRTSPLYPALIGAAPSQEERQVARAARGTDDIPSEPGQAIAVYCHVQLGLACGAGAGG